MCFFSNLARIIVCSTRRLSISPSDCVATRKVSHSHPVAVGWTSLVASRLREYEWNVMGIHYLLPFLRKLKIVDGPAQLLLFPVKNSFSGGNRRDSERIGTGVLPRNLQKWWQLHSQPMAVWIISSSEIIFLDASFILNALQRDRDPLMHELFFRCFPPGVNTGFVKEGAQRLLRKNSSRSTFNRKRTESLYTLKE